MPVQIEPTTVVVNREVEVQATELLYTRHEIMTKQDADPAKCLTSANLTQVPYAIESGQRIYAKTGQTIRISDFAKAAANLMAEGLPELAELFDPMLAASGACSKSQLARNERLASAKADEAVAKSDYQEAQVAVAEAQLAVTQGQSGAQATLATATQASTAAAKAMSDANLVVTKCQAAVNDLSIPQVP